MKSIIFTAIAVVTFSHASLADNQFYAGFKTGNLHTNFELLGGSESNDDFVLSAIGGHQWGRFSAEWQYSQGRIKLQEAPINIDIKSLGVYAVYRSEGALYGKVRIGLLENKSIVSINEYSLSESKTHVSIGTGIGYRVENVSIEAEYTRMEQNVDYWSVGFNFFFD